MTRNNAIAWQLLCIATLLGCTDARAPTHTAESLLVKATNNAPQLDEALWAKAIDPREFRFPEDHGAHEDFRIEWWYYTGNLLTAEGRRFGYQLTFFRTGVQRDSENPSRWVVRDLYTGHFAISDLEGQRHRSSQRSRRAGVGGAGAALDRLEVWNGDWRAEAQGDRHLLTATEEGFAINLTLEPGKGEVLQGAGGLSQKGQTEGNASYYYSMPRMPTEGTIQLDEETFLVTGDSWMDHEFSTSFLEPGQRGWDWLSLQLDDGSELMLYQMRCSDGSTDRYSSGKLIGSDGVCTELSSNDFRLEAGKTWRSPETGAEYPLQWRVEIESLGIQLKVAAAFEAQEMTTEATTGIAYWEGAVDVSGTRNDVKIGGSGYLELTGYTETELGSMLFE